MINPLEYTRYDTWIFCGSERSIEIYNNFNRPIHFSILIDRGEIDNIKSLQNLRYMKCSKCGKITKINYLNGIVQQLDDHNIDKLFMNGFKSFHNKKKK